MLKLAAIFKDGMILQRNCVVAVFGECDCDKIEAIFEEETYTADIEDGHFLIKVRTDDSRELCKLTIDGYKGDCKEVIEIEDILLGEVWLDGGQSNMELELQNSLNGMEVINASDFDEIRFYKVPKYPTIDEGLIECEKNTSWRKLKGTQCADMSAVAYYFATTLYEKLQVPIGIIDCYQGGTSATCWVSEEALKDVSEVKGYIREWEEEINAKSDEQYNKELDEYNATLDKWLKTVDRLKIERPDISAVDINAIAGPYPWPLPRGKASAFRPYGLHKTMLNRVAPYTVRGFIYYQAEEDADRADYYEKLNSALIKQWRADFSLSDNEGIKPFFITQLPMFISAGAEDDKKWCVLREQQYLCSQHNDEVGIAVIADCGEYDNIHPLDKEIPGKRLAAKVLMDVYKNEYGLHNLVLKDVRKGDNLESAQSSYELIFNDTYGALCYRKSDGEKLTARGENIALMDGDVADGIIYGFEISHDGTHFYPPHIRVKGDKLILLSEGEAVTDIRYGWFNYGVVNVYSKAGVPLMPFWKKITK